MLQPTTKKIDPKGTGGCPSQSSTPMDGQPAVGWAARLRSSTAPNRWKSLGERRAGPSPLAAPARAVELPCPFGG
eukprot:8407842-Karenia_brevis.AAC.1